MYRHLIIVTCLFLLCLQAQAQQAITLPQQQFIQNRAKSKVKTYTEYLELLARTKANEVDLRESYKQNIYLSCGKDGAKTRVYNDLIPPQVLQNNPALEKSIQLELYVNRIAEHYGENLSLSYSNMEVSDIYYSQADNWYFVKVTADRLIDGIYQSTSERIPYKSTDKVDFFVYANMVNGTVKPGGIYGVQPYSADNTYTKARIIQGTASDVVTVPKPIIIEKETIRNTFKRGKGHTIAWQGGLGDDIIQIELIPQDTVHLKKRDLGSMQNTNKYEFTPSNKDKNGTYQFKIKNISTGRYTQTGYFNIRRRIPLGALIGGSAIAVAAGIITYTQVRDQGSIPDPPSPEGN